MEKKKILWKKEKKFQHQSKRKKGQSDIIKITKKKKTQPFFSLILLFIEKLALKVKNIFSAILCWGGKKNEKKKISIERKKGRFLYYFSMYVWGKKMAKINILVDQYGMLFYVVLFLSSCFYSRLWMKRKERKKASTWEHEQFSLLFFLFFDIILGRMQSIFFFHSTKYSSFFFFAPLARDFFFLFSFCVCIFLVILCVVCDDNNIAF